MSPRVVLALVLACSALASASVSAAATPPPPAGPAPGGTALVTIDHVIDDGQEMYLKRALAEADDHHCARVLIHFVTDGGTLDAGRHMLGDLLAQPASGPELIAYIDDHCYSAGAMIAYGCQKIYLSPHATIGDIGVIFQGSDGEIHYAPEKFETVVRALLRAAAQARGWNAAKLQKMTALNQELYRFDLGHGQSAFVLEDDLPQWLADHPGIDPKAKILVAPDDRLLAYTGGDAVREGMATGLADSLTALELMLHVDPAQVLDLSPTQVERVSWTLAGWAPLLAAAAVLCVVLEFKFGGTGLFLILAAVCGIAFLTCQYYQQLASYPELLLMLGGVILIALELFVFPTAGWLLTLGAVLGATGLVLAFMPDASQFHPDAPEWGRSLGHALEQSCLALAIAAAGTVLLITSLPRTRVVQAMAAKGAIEATSASTMERAGALVGRAGAARTDLSPSGSILIDGKDLSATSEHGSFIPAGTPVTVVAMRYGAAVVRPTPADATRA